MSKKTVAPKKRSVTDKKRSTRSGGRPQVSKPSYDGADSDLHEFPRKEPNKKSPAKDQGRRAEDRKPESEDYSEEAAKLQAHVFAKKYRKRAQGFLWNRARLLNVGDFIKIAGFEREVAKQTGSKRPREVRVVWTKTE